MPPQPDKSKQAPMRKTLREWYAYLDSDTRELTLAEFSALMFMHQQMFQRELVLHSRNQSEALEHLEGMVGAMDAHMEVASGGNYPGSAAVRAALDAYRNREREKSRAELEQSQKPPALPTPIRPKNKKPREKKA